MVNLFQSLFFNMIWQSDGSQIITFYPLEGLQRTLPCVSSIELGTQWCILLYFHHCRDTLDTLYHVSTLNDHPRRHCFVFSPLSGRPIRNFITLSPLQQHLRGHFITYSCILGHYRGHFMMFYRPYKHLREQFFLTLVTSGH